MIITQEIILKKRNKHKNRQNYTDILIYEPDKTEKTQMGNLYLSMELIDAQRDIGHIVNLISSAIKREYYSKLGREPLASLEAGLKKANSLILEIIYKTDETDHNLKWIHKFNCICATVCDNIIYLTKTGGFNALLCRNGQLINIDNKLDASEIKANPLKTFHGIVSGSLELNDKIIFISSENLNCLGKERLEKIMQNGGISENREQIDNILFNANYPKPAAAIFLLEIAENPVCENSYNCDHITPPIDLKELLTQ